MSEKPETTEDIIRKMRNEIAELRKVSPNVPSIAADWWEARADEIEAVYKRERGDAAKLREAVGYILKYADSVACRDHDEHTRHYIDQIRKWAQSALAEPPRNCDVGTAEEQANRWYWRYHVGHLCQSCPLGPRKWSDIGAGWSCFSEWLQMPYEEGGAK